MITYQPPADSGIDNLVTHRIVSIEGDVFRTQGDANPDVDPWTFQLTSTSQSRVSYSVPYVGYVFIALQDRSLRMIVIGVPATASSRWSAWSSSCGPCAGGPSPAGPSRSPSQRSRSAS